MSATPDPVNRRLAWAALTIALLALWMAYRGSSRADEAFALADEANSRAMGLIVKASMADAASSQALEIANTAEAEARRVNRVASEAREIANEARETANRVARGY